MLELGLQKDRDKLLTTVGFEPGQNGDRLWEFEILIHKDKFGLAQA